MISRAVTPTRLDSAKFMKMRRLTLNLATKSKRDVAQDTLKTLCQKTGVDILDFTMFSNVSVVLQIEAKLFAIRALASELTSAEFRLSESSKAELASLSNDPLASDIAGTLQVTFATEDGNQSNPVPMIPG